MHIKPGIKHATIVSKQKDSTNYIISKKAAANRLKRQSKYFLSYHTRKRLQTANKSVLGVFPIYKVLAYVPNKENGCKYGFSGKDIAQT